MNEEDAAALLKENLSNRYWRLNNLYWIKDKAGKRIRFKMNWAQSKLYEERHYFNIILKARQLGFTTFSLIYFLDACLFSDNHAAGVIAHTQDDASDLFTNKVKFAYDNLPLWLKEQRTATQDSAKKLVFNNGSSFTIGTSLRSGTYQKLLISEFGKVSAKYPDKAREIKTGALNTIEAGQQIFVESTAEGKTGEFFDLCEQARANLNSGKNLSRLDPKFHFFAWFDNPEYKLTDEETKAIVITKETSIYLDKLTHLSPQQRAWYAVKEKTMGEDMRREYPSTPEESFEGSLQGAYYTKEMELVRKAGGITHVPYDRRYPVNTFWDLGKSRSQMSIWFHQLIDRQHRFINYHESNSQGWDYYASLLTSLGYNYKRHYFPHDGETRIVAGKIITARQFAEQVGIRPIHITPVTKSVWDDIRNYCKPLLPNCSFDEKNTAVGVKNLDNYKRKWDKQNSMWMNDAQPDEASHGADAFRTWAVNADKLGDVPASQSIMMG